jgi:hypothetical protein
LFVEGDEALEDIARFVGHAKPSTTAGYVKRLGRRPQSVAERAAAILDDYGRREGAERTVDSGHALRAACRVLNRSWQLCGPRSHRRSG